eukprot:TRINITY_DN9876_c1_g1_i2.p1 TRINITY_DN9876_c1_g1~~TRINITY_DN9876_c1_g1_i2.p1  ORF type:complete len:623 (+),score=168.02 TRINITY_DN9876_c1_g1_i2:75-1871(+)
MEPVSDQVGRQFSCFGGASDEGLQTHQTNPYSLHFTPGTFPSVGLASTNFQLQPGCASPAQAHAGQIPQQDFPRRAWQPHGGGNDGQADLQLHPGIQQNGSALQSGGRGRLAQNPMFGHLQEQSPTVHHDIRQGFQGEQMMEQCRRNKVEEQEEQLMEQYQQQFVQHRQTQQQQQQQQKQQQQQQQQQQKQQQQQQQHIEQHQFHQHMTAQPQAAGQQPLPLQWNPQAQQQQQQQHPQVGEQQFGQMPWQHHQQEHHHQIQQQQQHQIQQNQQQYQQQQLYNQQQQDQQAQSFGPSGFVPAQPALPPGPPCFCDQPSVQLTVKKEGPNTGRTFFKCQKPQGESCPYFQWGDEPPAPTGPMCVCQRPSTQRTVAKDGPNKGRPFFCCGAGRRCDFFQWADEEPPQKSTLVPTPVRAGGGNASESAGQGPPCQCGEPSVGRTVRKEGPNTGRPFFVCAKAQGPTRCDFFQWGDQPADTVQAWPSNGSCGGGGTPDSFGKAASGGGIAGGSTGECFRCGMPGHWSQNCPNQSDAAGDRAFGCSGGGQKAKGGGRRGGGRGVSRGRGRGARKNAVDDFAGGEEFDGFGGVGNQWGAVRDGPY